MLAFGRVGPLAPGVQVITFSEYTREEYARVCADRDEWMARALHYQARHEGLRGLQRAVQDVVRGLEDYYVDIMSCIACPLAASAC